MSGIKAYRIVHTDFRDSAFSGEGAKLYGGRWNEKGSAVVYLSNHPALAALEVLVHLEDEETLDNYCLFEIELPENQIYTLRDDQLPENWNEFPAPSSTIQIGQTWIRSEVSLALQVPSVTLSYQSYNFILNTQHSLFDDVVRQAISVPLELDARLN